ncbi:24168_t:CDS:2 [Dentiscutata erythropus]|uniref:24168_t:CDS:1 n=1 Tax=Dentiscutata erythropus TaxID=1348616 RepID=A0A9N8Z5F0_9GLOM|nr:24168_t:CDS:2 [Dentiscutata erythropus]
MRILDFNVLSIHIEIEVFKFPSPCVEDHKQLRIDFKFFTSEENMIKIPRSDACLGMKENLMSLKELVSKKSDDESAFNDDNIINIFKKKFNKVDQESKSNKVDQESKSNEVDQESTNNIVYKTANNNNLEMLVGSTERTERVLSLDTESSTSQGQGYPINI